MLFAIVNKVAVDVDIRIVRLLSSRVLKTCHYLEGIGGAAFEAPLYEANRLTFRIEVILFIGGMKLDIVLAGDSLVVENKVLVNGDLVPVIGIAPDSDLVLRLGVSGRCVKCHPRSRLYTGKINGFDLISRRCRKCKAGNDSEYRN